MSRAGDAAGSAGEAGEGAGGERRTPVSCTWCGATAYDVPVTWTMQTGERGVEWMCDACTRANLRSLEGRLPQDWW